MTRGGGGLASFVSRQLRQIPWLTRSIRAWEAGRELPPAIVFSHHAQTTVI